MTPFQPCELQKAREGRKDLKVAGFFTPQATLNDYVFHEDVRFPD